jgi:hypothetical protein
MNTHSVKNFQSIFEFSNSLEYINLYSFIIKNDATHEKIFNVDSYPHNLKICINDINTLNIWKEKSISSQQYKYAIHIWTKSDVEKRKYGSNLHFVELWNKNDIIRFIENLKEENYI